MDTGVEFWRLRGSERVGVYVGACGSDAHAAWLENVPNITGAFACSNDAFMVPQSFAKHAFAWVKK